MRTIGLIGVLLMAVGAVGCSGGDDGGTPPSGPPATVTTTTPMPDGSPTATATPLTSDVSAQLLKPGMRGLIGYDTVVYYHIDCFGCGGARTLCART
jgi:hypothetical protein